MLGGSILGSGYVALADEGSVSSAKVVQSPLTMCSEVNPGAVSSDKVLGGSILGSGYLALTDEGSVSSAKVVQSPPTMCSEVNPGTVSSDKVLGGSILGNGYLALTDEGSFSSAKAVGGECISILVRVWSNVLRWLHSGQWISGTD